MLNSCVWCVVRHSRRARIDGQFTRVARYVLYLFILIYYIAWTWVATALRTQDGEIVESIRFGSQGVAVLFATSFIRPVAALGCMCHRCCWYLLSLLRNANTLFRFGVVTAIWRVIRDSSSCEYTV
jgi:hypothetical protein